jgi:hypothetical protein
MFEQIKVANIIFVALWVASIVYAQNAQKAKYDRITDPLSDYLVDGPVIDGGFVCLALAMVCYAAITSPWAMVFYLISGVGALLVVATKTIYSGHKRLHNISAGMAYGGTGVGNIVASIHHPFLLGVAVTAPIVVGSLILMKVSTAAQERIVAIVMIGWFVAALFLFKG